MEGFKNNLPMERSGGKEEKMKNKLVIAVMKDGVQKRVVETGFPEKHKWESLGLQIRDLLVFDNDCDLVFWLQEDEE